jgi:hypothetical protein
MSKFICLISIFLFALPLVSEEISEQEIYNFRGLLKTRNFKEAETMISRFSDLGMDEPRIELLETELWIEKADDLYNKKQYKSAFPYYNNAYVRWRTNPKIKERYNELAGKILLDEAMSNHRQNQPSHNKEEGIVTLDPTISNTLEFINAERIDTLDHRIWILTLISGFLLMLNITVLFLFKTKNR